jgi:hypothetical protein
MLKAYLLLDQILCRNNLEMKGTLMSDKPFDPAAPKATPDSYEETLGGQQGPDVEYEDGQFQSENMQESSERGRTGSYEARNMGGYGTALPDAQGKRHADERPVIPPDPEAQQGQGGQ